jgi:hemerythrin superfamily protein
VPPFYLDDKTHDLKLERLLGESSLKRLLCRLPKLMDAVEHHVQEEEGDMFPKIRELFDEDELEQLGQELESAKDMPQRQVV